MVLNRHAEGADSRQPARAAHQGRATPFKFARRALAGQDYQAPLRMRTVYDLLSQMGEKRGQLGQIAVRFSPLI